MVNSICSRNFTGRQPQKNNHPKFYFQRRPIYSDKKCKCSIIEPPEQSNKTSCNLAKSFFHASLAALVCFGSVNGSVANVLSSEGTVIGDARVVDGDTLVVNGVRIRLYGIDAPEKKQLCLDVSGKEIECGVKSAQALKREIGKRPVACSLHGRDLYGRAVGVCSIENKLGVTTDLNSWMVDKGHAVSF